MVIETINKDNKIKNYGSISIKLIKSLSLYIGNILVCHVDFFPSIKTFPFEICVKRNKKTIEKQQKIRQKAIKIQSKENYRKQMKMTFTKNHKVFSQ